jgi:hypothetical protein
MAATIQIENKVVLLSSTLILNDNETARVEIQLPLNAPISIDTVRLSFKCTDGKESQLSWTTNGNLVAFELSGKKLDGATFVVPTPLRFGEQGGKDLFIDFTYTRMSSRNVVTLLVLQAGALS